MGSENISSQEDRSSPEIIRRKFSLTKRHDDIIDELADKHYGGNRSQCVRSALEDHARTLDGVGEPLLRQIADDVSEVKERFSSLQENLEDSDKYHPTEVDSGTDENVVLTSEEEFSDEMWVVYRRLSNKFPGDLSEEEIVTEIELPAVDIRHALIDLVDAGFAQKEMKGGTAYYQMTTDESTPSPTTP